MQVTKIVFSDKEMETMMDADFFHLKYAVTDKVYLLFGELEGKLKEEPLLKEFQYENLETDSGKIYKGENYKKLPYVLLDFPKLFSADNIFSFRSMFWWGNEFSFTLHLQGQALEKHRHQLEKNMENLTGQGFYFCINASPWEYAFTDDNYQLLDDFYKINKASAPDLSSREFIKLSRRIPLQEYDNAINYGLETFKLSLGLLK